MRHPREPHESGCALRYTCDHPNSLTQVTEPSLPSQFAYNGDGVRVGETIGAATIDYLVDLAATLPVVIRHPGGVYLYGLGSGGRS